MRDPDREWEALARTDPYFAVLTDPRFHEGRITPELIEEFFATGRKHIDSVLRKIRAHLAPNFEPRAALDFGCGVGRLLLPLAQECQTVVGVDVSETMLQVARRHCETHGISNVTLVRGDDRLTRVSGSYDLIHSFIVFQHIPQRRGEKLLSRLVELLSLDGVGVLHFTYHWHRKSAPLRRVVHALRKRVPLLHNVLNLVRGRPLIYPLMEMHHYNLNTLFRTLQKHGCHCCYVEFTQHADHSGVVLFFQRNRLPESIW